MITPFFVLTIATTTCILTVKDKNTGAPISDANIVCRTHHRGAATGNDGTVRFQLEPGKHVLQISHIAFEQETLVLFVKTGKPMTRFVRLRPRVWPGDELLVADKREKPGQHVQTINHETLARSISVGEPDVLCAVHLLTRSMDHPS